MEENIPIISRIFQNSDDEPCIASTKIHDYFLDAITYISFVAVIQANIGYYWLTLNCFLNQQEKGII